MIRYLSAQGVADPGYKTLLFKTATPHPGGQICNAQLESLACLSL